MHKNQNKTVMILMGVIIVLLLVVIGLFLVTQGKGDKKGNALDSAKGTQSRSDSVRLSDPRKLAAFQNFFDSYSRANQMELTEELTWLYTDPAIYGKNTYSRIKMRSTLANFFANTDPVQHYFSNLVAYEYESGTVSAYITEFHASLDLRMDKVSRFKVYKNFRLVPTNNGYKCAEQHIISTLNPDQ